MPAKGEANERNRGCQRQAKKTRTKAVADKAEKEKSGESNKTRRPQGKN
ncbi:hypothetical protein [Paraburkholderia diazotrophica]|nr:hypothetical protein [Paraburkholderia diazotrophica]